MNKNRSIDGGRIDRAYAVLSTGMSLFKEEAFWWQWWNMVHNPENNIVIDRIVDFFDRDTLEAIVELQEKCTHQWVNLGTAASVCSVCGKECR